MSTIKLTIKLETDTQQVNFSDYNSILPPKYNIDGGEDNLFVVTEKTFTNWYNTKLNNYYTSPSVSFTYNNKTLEGNLLFLESSISEDLDSVVSEAKSILYEIFKEASTQKNNIPKKPDYYLSLEDLDNGVYDIVYSIREPQIEEPSPVVEQPITNEPDPTPEQEFEENLSETSTTNQEQGREERTSENINQINENKQGEPVSPGIRNVLKNEVKADKISFDTPANDSEREEIAESLGILPFLWYNAYQIDYVDIQFLELSIKNGLPTLNATFLDTFNKMKDEGFP
ncbi:hypothetical protein EBU94_08315, partial [bacterium]|nr:hypothetical protein [bacterium]